MGEPNLEGACLRAGRGELVCLRSIKNDRQERVEPETPATPSQPAFSAPLESAEFPEFGLSLQLVKVMPGSELGAIDRLRTESDVIAVSLNYLGRPTALLKFRKPPQPRDEWRMLSNENEPTPSRTVAAGAYSRVLVIDVDPEHCQLVMQAVAEGVRSIPDAPLIEIIGRSLAEDGGTLASLYDYVGLLLRGASIDGTILAINMSVDWGIACDHGAPLVNEVSTVSVSFPFFEHVLERVHRRVRERNSRTLASDPAYFAAAGNQDVAIRWRMAYPAVLPNVFAATFVSPPVAGAALDTVRLAIGVDCPAVFDIKPCFAVSSDALPENLRDGSSFACAWLAGRYASLAASDSDGVLAGAPMFAKTAMLQAMSSVRALATPAPCWARPSVSVIDRASTGTGRLTSLRGLLAELNRIDSDAEFVVTGSMALVDVLLSQAGRDWPALREVSRIFGDIDIVQSGRQLPEEKRARATQIVRAWLQREMGAQHSRLDWCLLEQRLSAPMLAQCIVPASQLLITAAGVVDATAGQRDLELRQLRILLPASRHIWDLNPQFLSEAAGVAQGVLVWVNSALLMHNVSHALGLPQGSTLDNDSVESVRTALAAAAHDVDAQQRNFGVNPSAGAERFGRRIARAHLLLQTAKQFRLDVSGPRDVLRMLEDAPVPA